MKEETRKAMRVVDLSQQITNRIIHGFPIAAEDRIEAEELGIDVAAMEIALGAEPEVSDYDYDSED